MSDLVVNYTGAATSLSASFDYGSTYVQNNATIELAAYQGETTGLGLIELFWTNPTNDDQWIFQFEAALATPGAQQTVVAVSQLDANGNPIAGWSCVPTDSYCGYVTWLLVPAGLVGNWSVSMSSSKVPCISGQVLPTVSVQFDKVNFTVPQGDVTPGVVKEWEKLREERRHKRRHRGRE